MLSSKLNSAVQLCQGHNDPLQFSKIEHRIMQSPN